MRVYIATTLSDLDEIYERRAHARYGRTRLSQRAHALQAGGLAIEAGLVPALVVAALLHDVGHMVHELGEYPAGRGIDDRHDLVGAAWLGQIFGPDVTEPVRLHVAAKRFLCATEPGYRDRLAPEDLLSLDLQGGPMDAAEQRAFEREVYAGDALALRRIDDAACDPERSGPSWATFSEVIRSVAQATPTGAGRWRAAPVPS